MISYFELIMIVVAATSSTFMASEAVLALDWTSDIEEVGIMSLEGDRMIVGIDVLAEGEESVEVVIIVGGIGLG